MGLRVEGLGFRVWSLGFRVAGLGSLGLWDPGFWGSELGFAGFLGLWGLGFLELRVFPGF